MHPRLSYTYKNDLSVQRTIFTEQTDSYYKYYLHVALWQFGLFLSFTRSKPKLKASSDLLTSAEVKGEVLSSLQVRCCFVHQLPETSAGSRCDSTAVGKVCRRRLVQRFLLDPDRGAADGLAVPQVATQDVLAELGRVDPPAAGRLHAEALLEETLQDLQTDRRTAAVSGYLRYDSQV